MPCQPRIASFALDTSAPVGLQLIASLRACIVTGELTPGTAYRSRTPPPATACRGSRCARLIRLFGEKLVEVRPQRGTYLRKIDVAEVEVSRFVRKAVEADIARLVARCADAAAVAELRRQMTGQAEVAQEGGRSFVQLDELFHCTLAEIAGRAGA